MTQLHCSGLGRVVLGKVLDLIFAGEQLFSVGKHGIKLQFAGGQFELKRKMGDKKVMFHFFFPLPKISIFKA